MHPDNTERWLVNGLIFLATIAVLALGFLAGMWTAFDEIATGCRAGGPVYAGAQPIHCYAPELE